MNQDSLDPLAKRLLQYDEALERGLGPEQQPGKHETETDHALNDTTGGDPADDLRPEECLQLIEAIRVISPNALADAFGSKVAGSLEGGSDNPSETANRLGRESQPPTQIGRFRLIRQLGQGGYGVVFLAYDPSLNRNVALKVPRPEVLVTTGLRERFLREAEAAAALDHPHIVPVYEAGAAGPICFIASAYCGAGTLSEWLLDHGQVMDPHAAAEVTAALSSAVQHAHERGVLHRDIKPGNVLIDAAHAGDRPAQSTLSDRVRLADFGLARILQDKDADEHEQAGLVPQTTTAGIAGTPAYMAPEQAANRRNEIGPKTDVYALGATLYHLLTGKPPIVAASPVETLAAIITEEPLEPHRHQPGVPRDLSAICMKALSKRGAGRYATAAELEADLSRFLTGRQVIARPLGQLRRSWRWCRSNPAVATLCGIIALLIGVTLITFSALWQRAERHRAVAETKSQQLTESMHSLFRVLSSSPELRGAGADPLRRRVIEQAEQVYALLTSNSQDSGPVDPLMQFDQARSIFEVAKILDAMGASSEALARMHDALSIVSQIPATDLHKLAAKRHTDLGYWWVSKGHLQTKLGLFEEAQASFSTALSRYEQQQGAASVPSHSLARAHMLGQEALTAIQRKDVSAALAASKESEALWRDSMRRSPLEHWRPSERYSLANCWLILAQVYDVADEVATSERLLAEALEIAQADEVTSGDEMVRALRAKLNHHFGISVARQERFGEARKAYKTALTEFESLVSDYPDVVQHREFLNSARYSLAYTELTTQNTTAARKLLHQNIASHRKLVQQSPDQAALYWDRVGDNYGVLAMSHKDGGSDEARAQSEALVNAETAYTKSLEARPDWSEPRVGRARARTWLAGLLSEAGDREAAAEHYALAIAELTDVLESSPDWQEARTALEAAEAEQASLPQAPAD